jgi:hypothetical protein
MSNSRGPAHPEGERDLTTNNKQLAPVEVDTYGGKIHVE